MRWKVSDQQGNHGEYDALLPGDAIHQFGREMESEWYPRQVSDLGFLAGSGRYGVIAFYAPIQAGVEGHPPIIVTVDKA